MFLTPMLKLIAEKQTSDLFISVETPIYIKILGTIIPINSETINNPTIKKITYELISQTEQQEYERNWKMNLSFPVPDVDRFRMNIFRQRGNIAMIIRYLRSHTADLDALRLPPMLKDLIMEKRGLVLIVNATGSSKSTTLAAMIEYRNATRDDHVLTIEDPIEFVFKHQRYIINQHEMDLDTKSYHNALINTMRKTPDILMIGKIRDRETLQQTLLYTQTDHLCLSTLHANNSYHALNRIINFFPYETRTALLNDLAIYLKTMISQHLMKTMNSNLITTIKMLLNSKHIQELIKKNKIDQIKKTIEKNLSPNSISFEQTLFKLYVEDKITRDEALRNSDSTTNLAQLMNNAEQKTKTTKDNSSQLEHRSKSNPTSFDHFKIDINTNNQPRSKNNSRAVHRSSIIRHHARLDAEQITPLVPS